MGWNKWVRQIHRWVSIIFTPAMTGGAMPPPWVTYAPLLPLFILLFTGLYLFVLPYLSRGKGL